MAGRAPLVPKTNKPTSGSPTELSNPTHSLETNQRPHVTDEQIRARAYELYLERGSGAGTELDDWLQAEAELNPHRE